MERRELFKIIAAGALAGPEAMAQGHHHADTQVVPRPAPFFSPVQQAVLDRLSDIIIPADETSPGAHDAAVVGYIDLLAGTSSAARQQQWVRGLEAVEAAVRSRFAHSFGECSPGQQEQIVAEMAAHEGHPQNELERFFELLKPAVVDGYRYSEVGVKQYMGWAGNRFHTAAWEGACHHPEHGAKRG